MSTDIHHNGENKCAISETKLIAIYRCKRLKYALLLFFNMIEFRHFSILLGALILIVGAGFVCLPMSGYAQNATKEGSNIFDVRLQNITTWPNIHANVKTDFNPNVTSPQIQASAFIHPFAVVIGDCYIGKLVLVAPTAVCRGDEGTPIHVG